MYSFLHQIVNWCAWNSRWRGAKGDLMIVSWNISTNEPLFNTAKIMKSVGTCKISLLTEELLHFFRKLFVVGFRFFELDFFLKFSTRGGQMGMASNWHVHFICILPLRSNLIKMIQPLESWDQSQTFSVSHKLSIYLKEYYTTDALTKNEKKSYNQH